MVVDSMVYNCCGYNIILWIQDHLCRLAELKLKFYELLANNIARFTIE